MCGEEGGEPVLGEVWGGHGVTRGLGSVCQVSGTTDQHHCHVSCLMSQGQVRMGGKMVQAVAAMHQGL